MSENFVERIGGVFPPEPLGGQANGFLKSLLGPEDDLRHMMSGRCGIMLAIEDFLPHDKRRVAYLPSYTCETVSGCFVKAGYQVLYYDFDQNLIPQYDENLLGKISLLSLCGYFGFPTMEEVFAAKARQAGVKIIFDATHSAFSEGGISPSAHYVVASLRKWLPVACGGIAIKVGGSFAVEPIPLHQEHLSLRYAYLKAAQAGQTAGADMLQTATDNYWQAEMLLREIYQAQTSDAPSIEIVNQYPLTQMKQQRRENYAALLADFPEGGAIKPVFPTLPPGVCPSHFSVYSEKRDELLQQLKAENIYATVYWPTPPFIEIENYPGAKWIYQHILSLPCDQRYRAQHMRRIAQVLAKLSSK